ncbi:Synaptic vesicle 2-related protein [Holothuria leucospilota]|uniref:Synaptic vesicle 2-related protein n=1 Tax=Holothuria leucospilota TaxID=206669 RepID=A0A9Q1CG13_HOLLE|nr:Synaptic vesicle 2-related protein [Holothuria leucospilota]
MKLIDYFLTESKVYTIQEAVNTVGNRWFQLWTGITCGLIWMADAIALLLLSVMAVVLRCEWQLTVFQSSSVTTIPFLCQIIGAYFWGIYSDKYGRKSILFLTTALLFWFSVLSACSTDITWFLICRCVSTFMIGGSPQAIAYFMEFLPTKKRGAFVSIFETLPESPYYHVSIGATKDVKKTFQTIAKWNNEEPISGGIKMEVQEVSFRLRRYTVAQYLHRRMSQGVRGGFGLAVPHLAKIYATLFDISRFFYRSFVQKSIYISRYYRYTESGFSV